MSTSWLCTSMERTHRCIYTSTPSHRVQCADHREEVDPVLSRGSVSLCWYTLCVDSFAGWLSLPSAAVVLVGRAILLCSVYIHLVCV